ncbi:hypothetical protein [Geobacter sp.]|uniref:hypothetical protein n=1 Tax=Geobacter sp. TaxID=46610 RepID=UPI001ACCE7D7|nr:hypothetical protein [Geobacter sp.]CAG1771700.1 hypothetical protein BAC3_02004 [uncultured bacterium]
MTKKEMIQLEQTLYTMECVFEQMVIEFGKTHAPKLPISVRSRLMKVATIAWATEELHRAVQRFHGDKYELAKPVEDLNNANRILYIQATKGFTDKIPSIPLIMSRHNE